MSHESMSRTQLLYRRESWRASNIIIAVFTIAEMQAFSERTAGQTVRGGGWAVGVTTGIIYIT